jgi:hypothetical protein
MVPLSNQPKLAIPTLSESCADITSWFNKYELYGRLNGWQAAENKTDLLLEYLPLFLSGQIEVSFNQLSPVIRMDYLLVKKELTKRYGLKPQDAYRRFVSATFPKQGQVDGFADELRRLIGAVTNIPPSARDALVLNQFLLGLPDESAEKIILACERKGQIELDAVLDKARIMLSRPAPIVAAAISPKKRESDETWKSKQRCYNCNQIGHIGKDCKKPKKPKNATAGAPSSQ